MCVGVDVESGKLRPKTGLVFMHAGGRWSLEDMAVRPPQPEGAVDQEGQVCSALLGAGCTCLTGCLVAEQGWHRLCLSLHVVPKACAKSVLQVPRANSKPL